MPLRVVLNKTNCFLNIYKDLVVRIHWKYLVKLFYVRIIQGQHIEQIPYGNFLEYSLKKYSKTSLEWTPTGPSKKCSFYGGLISYMYHSVGLIDDYAPSMLEFSPVSAK
jgi:hypothetical protein